MMAAAQKMFSFLLLLVLLFGILPPDKSGSFLWHVFLP